MAIEPQRLAGGNRYAATGVKIRHAQQPANIHVDTLSVATYISTTLRRTGPLTMHRRQSKQNAMAKSALQRELRKKHPFSSAEQEAALNIVRTQDFLQGEFADLFTQYDLSGPQYNVLRILRGTGGEGVRTTEISAQMVARTPDITRLVDRLEKAGLVCRARTSADRRVVLVSITKAGLELLARLDKPVLELHARLMKRLSKAELAELIRLLEKVRQAEASES